jgi:hypothetical protein
MADAHLSVSYHPRSEVGLGSSAERDLARLIEARDGFVEIRARPLPKAGEYSRGGGSWVAEHINFILVIAGGIIAKGFLEELSKDLYKFFRGFIQSQREAKRAGDPVHYAIILDLRLDGERYHSVISFKDEETMKIALYRLHQYLSNEPDASARVNPKEGFVELIYPTGFNAGYSVPLIFGSLVVVGGARSSEVQERLYDWLPFLSGLGSAGLLAISLTIVAVSWVLILIRPLIRERRYRRAFREKAQEWLRNSGLS